MNKQEERELNERMLEFAEWERLGKSNVGNPPQRRGEDFQAFGMNLPDFPSDPTACFHPEWGVVRKLHSWTMGSCPDGDVCAVAVLKENVRGEACAETPALALCLAVRDSLDKELSLRWLMGHRC